MYCADPTARRAAALHAPTWEGDAEGGRGGQRRTAGGGRDEGQAARQAGPLLPRGVLTCMLL